LTKIYTRKGDDGSTRLFDGTPTSKAAPRVAAYGDVDELSCVIGLARAHAAHEGRERLDDLSTALATIQRDLLALGALLADPRRDGKGAEGMARDERLELGADRVSRLEAQIDSWEEELPPLRQFILPAGCRTAAALHLARTTCRRAERAVVDVVGAGAASSIAIVYLNRLSDLLFVAARLANARAGIADEPW
jgi:cob(I)alamin adenosyltransferase